MKTAAPLYLDVRNPEEHAEGCFKTSLNIPLDALCARLRELGPPSREIVVYCRSGRRSAKAAELLREAGFCNVRDAGGLNDLLASTAAGSR